MSSRILNLVVRVPYLLVLLTLANSANRPLFFSTAEGVLNNDQVAKLTSKQDLCLVIVIFSCCSIFKDPKVHKYP